MTRIAKGMVAGFAESHPSPIFPAIEDLAVIGDRRTAAMVAPDGTMPWLCLPNYDGQPVFGHLLDPERGGYCRFGPADGSSGTHRYLDRTAVLVTRWPADAWELELTDAMLWPDSERSPGREAQRVVLRRMRCLRGSAPIRFRLRVRDGFDGQPSFHIGQYGAAWLPGSGSFGLWTSFPMTDAGGEAQAEFALGPGEEAWAVLGHLEVSGWSAEEARAALDQTVAYWRRWHRNLIFWGARRDRVRRSATTFHLLGFAPTGAVVAAPTASLPEVIQGGKNYDYRYAWIRDASLSLAILAMLGDLETARSYMDWLAKLDSSTEMPLQVLYRIDGGTDVSESKHEDLTGYRGSQPVRFGNGAFKQLQIDSLGYLADCALIYLEQGGGWRPEYGRMIQRIAGFTAANWRRPDSGIWELDAERHYVSSKVMAWVVLDRALKIARRVGLDEADLATWRSIMEAIHAEVMERGWSEARQAFRQHYDTDDLDASVLLIPVMRFLPPDHPKVLATIDRIADRLGADGFVWRFATRDRSGAGEPPGEPPGEEGAFLPCTFWLATSYALTGRPGQAEAILARVEAISGDTGLFAEEADPRHGGYLGNTPLLFSHAEYLKSVLEIAKARWPTWLALMAGQGTLRVRRLFR